MAVTEILKLTDFEVRPYRIPNQEESKDLLAFISNQEQIVLRELLGHQLYESLRTGLTEDPVPAIWTALVEGGADYGEYTLNEKVYNFPGLKACLIARVYAEWLSETRDKFTDIGTVYNTSDRNEHVSPAGRIAAAYNTFARMVGGPCELQNTMFGFIESTTDYDGFGWSPNDYFKYPGRMNEFGL